MIKRFVSLKGQPIHKGHCYLIRAMLDDYQAGDELIIGIVNPSPEEPMDLSRNRRPANFHPEKNPLSYFERIVLLTHYLHSLHAEYGASTMAQVIIVPYFIPTIYPLAVMYNYLDIRQNCVEYISNKDEFELGKEKELHEIGVNVKFVEGMRDADGQFFSADKIRDKICQGQDLADDFEPVLFHQMQQHFMFDKIRERVQQRASHQHSTGA